MATIRKRGAHWQAIVRRGTVSKSASFESKAQASAWATSLEAEIIAQKRGEIPPGKTFGDLLRRYQEEVTVTKRGAKWESDRINATLRDPIANVKLTSFSPTDAAGWRDRRLAEVSNGSVLREWNILSNACTRARKEWGWLRENPFREISRPETPKSRDRRPTDDEVTRILYALGCDPQVTPTTMMARAGFAFLFAIETAMRAGEIVGMRWADVTGTTVKLKMTKNGHAREVPLTMEARRLLTLLPRSESVESVFQIDSYGLDALFRKARARALVVDLHFHDTRREALTRLSQKVDVMTLAKISGHRDLRILQNTYYAPKMDEVAARLG